MGPKHGYTRCFDTMVLEQTEDGWKIKFQNFTGSKGCAIGAVARSYAPATATEAFANHMQAFYEQDMDRILKDFTETTQFRAYIGNTGEFNEYTGLAGVR